MKQNLRLFRFTLKATLSHLTTIFLVISASAQSYTYDTEGKVTKDGTKGLDSIYYNQLDLIERVDLSDGRQVWYRYDAQGNRLTKTVATPGKTTTTIAYSDGVEYASDRKLLQLATDEGRLISDTLNRFTYQYHLKDHLSNVRAGFDATGPKQTNSYYPFGNLQPAAEWVNGNRNKYLLTGKEQQEELALFDFGARMLDVVPTRWQTIDPLSEKHYELSPYAYVKNNPVSYVDPDGRDWTITTTTDKEGNTTTHLQLKAAVLDLSGESIEQTFYFSVYLIRQQNFMKLFDRTYTKPAGFFTNKEITEKYTSMLYLRLINREEDLKPDEHLITVVPNITLKDHGHSIDQPGGKRITVDRSTFVSDEWNAELACMHQEFARSLGLDYLPLVHIPFPYSKIEAYRTVFKVYPERHEGDLMWPHGFPRDKNTFTGYSPHYKNSKLTDKQLRQAIENYSEGKVNLPPKPIK